MQNAIQKEILMKYVDDVLMPATASDIRLVQSVENEEEELKLWLVEMEDGEEYWLLENDSPCGIYKKCGIYADEAYVIETYRLMKQREQEKTIKDRFSYTDNQ